MRFGQPPVGGDDLFAGRSRGDGQNPTMRGQGVGASYRTRLAVLPGSALACVCATLAFCITRSRRAGLLLGAATAVLGSPPLFGLFRLAPTLRFLTAATLFRLLPALLGVGTALASLFNSLTLALLTTALKFRLLPTFPLGRGTNLAIHRFGAAQFLTQCFVRALQLIQLPALLTGRAGRPSPTLVDLVDLGCARLRADPEQTSFGGD